MLKTFCRKIAAIVEETSQTRNLHTGFQQLRTSVMLKTSKQLKNHFSAFCTLCFHFYEFRLLICFLRSALIFCIFKFVIITTQCENPAIFVYFLPFLCVFFTLPPDTLCPFGFFDGFAVIEERRLGLG